MSTASTTSATPEASIASPLDWRTRWSVALGLVLLRILAATWRVRIVGREAWRADATHAAAPVLFTLWHGQMLPILHAHQGLTTSVLVSEHRDGEIIARILSAFGFGSIRGSSSRGGARALLQMAAALRDGISIAITPDGPRGPRHVYAPGAVILAQRAAVRIVPIVAHASRAWRLPSWDRFEIPKPFSRVTVLYAPAVSLHADTAREAASQVELFATGMAAAMADCEKLSR